MAYKNHIVISENKGLMMSSLRTKHVTGKEWKDYYEEMRANLKSMKKKLDSMERMGKAAVSSTVSEDAKALLLASPNQPVIVKELHALSNTKALDGALKQVKVLSPETAAMFFSVDPDANKIVCLSAVPKNAVNKGLKANEWVQQVAGLMQGKGGGKAESAQASGSNVSCLQEALNVALQFAYIKLGGDNPVQPPPPNGVVLHTHPNNIRAFKAQIAAQYSGKQLSLSVTNFEVGKSNQNLEYLKKFPLGQLPALEDADNEVYLFDCNAIALYVANAQMKGGDSPLIQAQVLQWMCHAKDHVTPCVSNWVYPCLGISTPACNLSNVQQTKGEIGRILTSLNTHLLTKTYLVGERVSLADIAMFCSLLPLYQHVLDPNSRKPYTNVNRWFETILHQPQVSAIVKNVKLCETAAKVQAALPPQPVEGKQKQDKPKEMKKKSNEETEELDLADEALAAEPKQKDPLEKIPKGNFDLDDFKRCYSNEEESKSIPYLWEKLDTNNWSLWFCEYKYPEELRQTFMSCNLITGMFQRLDKLRKNAFASMCLFGEPNNSTISGIWLWRGHELAFELSSDWQVDYESYTWTRLDPASPKTKDLVQQYLSWTGTDKEGRKMDQGKIFK